MDDALRRRESEVAWELRGAWATLRELVVVWPGGRVRGFVEYVAPTDAFCLMWDGRGTIHVPLGLLPSVRRPHFHEPADGEPVVPPMIRQRVPLPMPGQLSLPLEDRRVDTSDWTAVR